MIQLLAEIVFPSRCFGCGVFLLGAERGACARCAHTVHIIESPRCLRCGMPRELRTGVDATCSSCTVRPPAYDAVWARHVYDGAIAAAIRRAKTSGDPSSLLSLIDSSPVWWSEIADLLRHRRWTTPPPHPRDLARRGWDPARAAGRYALKRHGIRFEDPLRKVRRGTKQALLTAEKRRESLRGAFVGDPLQGQWVVLDDVITTGATLEEISRTLRRLGATSVVGVAVARSV